MLDGHLEAATVWQSIAHMRHGSGDAKDTLMAASTEKQRRRKTSHLGAGTAGVGITAARRRPVPSLLG